ncbi:MAG TPA: insulinase family protein, partial [Candidatus Nanopelagicales bacterium]|nr:insulinase family protein [Candidatus Nanopelagicales bacterium]
MTGGSTRRAVVIAALVALAGCVSSASPAKQAPSRNDGAGLPVESAGPKPAPVAEVREEPQPSAPVRPFRCPAPVWAELKSGLDVATIVTRGVPEVEIRAVIPGGRAADGERPGVAEITGELLLEGGAGALAGRELLARMEALGGKLAVETTLDATVIRVSAPREALGPAVGLLGQVLERPRLGPAALDEVKRRAIAQVRDLARDDARWAALTILHRELYLLRTERHPYSSPASTAAEFAQITAADCRAFFQRQFTPARTSIIVAGDVAPDAVRAAAEAAFTGRARRDPEEPSLTDPMPPSSLKITLVDRPGSADSEIHLGFLGPARGDRDWVAFEIAGRLLASAAPLDVARGPVPMVAHAAVPAAKTGLAVEGLLAEAERLSTAGPA